MANKATVRATTTRSRHWQRHQKWQWVPWTQTPFWLPKIPPSLKCHACPRVNRLPLWLLLCKQKIWQSFFGRAFTEPIRHGKKSALVRVSSNERWMGKREKGKRQRGRASGRDEPKEIKLIAKCWRRARKRSHKAKRREKTHIQISFIGFQGQWIVSILYFFLSATVSHCLPPPPALFFSSVSFFSFWLHWFLLNHSFHCLGLVSHIEVLVCQGSHTAELQYIKTPKALTSHQPLPHRYSSATLSEPSELQQNLEF